MCRLVKQGKTLANVASLFNIAKTILTLASWLTNQRNTALSKFIIIRPPDNYPFLYGTSVRKACSLSSFFFIVSWSVDFPIVPS